VLDGKSRAAITDYRWIIEEDRTFYVDPTKTTNTGGTTSTTVVPTYGTNFHTSYMPLVAAGCTGPLSCEAGQTLVDPTTGSHAAAVCDIGNGVCRTTQAQQTPVMPSTVHLDPTKRYYISVLPGDAANPFNTGNASGGHGMGGAPILFPGAIAGTTPSVTILTEPTPLPTAKLSVFVFQDDFPLNGENDAGGNPAPIAPNEPGLGGFEIILFDDAGGTGDATGQMTDRKSTRLNSSHLVISYAGFCLKKKKRRRRRARSPKRVRCCGRDRGSAAGRIFARGHRAGSGRRCWSEGLCRGVGASPDQRAVA